MKRLSSVLVVCGVVAAALLTPASGSAAASRRASAHAASTAAGIAWGACSDPALQQANAQCGFLSVPLDYSNPHGQQIQLAVSRIVHTSDDYQGALLTNPGGPGGSGLNLNVFLIGALQQEGLGSAAAGYDWIGFDPRGVGSSIPALSCIPNYFSPDRPNYVPLTSRLLSFWLAKSKSYAQACASANPLQEALLPT